MARRTSKTWLQLEQQLGETFRKWGIELWSVRPGIARNQSARRHQTREERMVSLGFWFGDRRVRLHMARHDRALDNMAAVARAIELIRMAEVRGLTDLILKIYQQMYPDEPVVERPRPAPRRPVPVFKNPYATLCVATNAPLEVAEAAYRALAKQAHPDVGGSSDRMKTLNAAIEQIRVEHERAKPR